MSFAPPEAGASRALMWVGAIIVIVARIMWPHDDLEYFIAGMSLVVIGLAILPKHPGGPSGHL